MNVLSELYSLKDIETDRLRFVVPIYQRLYVWGDDQVKTLMEDLLHAFLTAPESPFFIGNTLVMARDGDGKKLELIDGQQRFTTLWLISQVWQGNLTPFLSVQYGEGIVPRLRFEIRDGVNRFFESHQAGQSSGQADTLASDQKGMVAITTALALIRSYRDGKVPGNQPEKSDAESKRWQSLDHDKFIEFIHEKVQLVLTTVPAHTDLNKLFEVINNRGIQLQHHEILKARLLGLLDYNQREPYAILWDACAGMGDYVERNLRELAHKDFKLTALFQEGDAGLDGEALADAEKVIAALTEAKGSAKPDAPEGNSFAGDKHWDGMALSDILGNCPDDEKLEKSQSTANDGDDDPARSILGFPLLLLHTLRIWRFKQNQVDLPRIQDKELLKLFDEYFLQEVTKDSVNKATNDSVISFIKLLWEVRYLFDKHIIKWVKLEKDEVHLIRRPSLNGSSVVRSEEAACRAFSLLQSMLYHSQDITTQYWITPLLHEMHQSRKSGSVENLTRYLQRLDNQLFCTGSSETLAVRTWNAMQQLKSDAPLDCGILKSQALGTGFPHYWFYKLEYVLWSAWGNDSSRSNEPYWKNFRFTAKSSIEHVHPQNPRAGTTAWEPKDLDGFGNLALVSSSFNSEQSNHGFSEKRGKFQDNKERAESLKLVEIFQNETWTQETAEAHKEAMIGRIRDYFQSVSEQND